MAHNPFREKAQRARALADKLNAPKTDPMAEAFPLGAGYGHGSQRSRERKLNAHINGAVKATEATRRANYLEALADRFDRGEVNAQGKPPARPRAKRKEPERDGPRLFIGIFAGGVSYADRWREVSGDYKRVAFLPWDTLELEVRGRPDAALLAEAQAHAATIQAKRGQEYPVSATGQTVHLGPRA